MFEARIDVRDLERMTNDVFPEFTRQLPFAASWALLDTARDVRKELIGEIDAKFDRPTPWVIRGMLVQAPRKEDVRAGNMYAVVYANDARDKGMGTTTAQILVPHLKGGGRKLKRSEVKLGSYAMPGSGAALDAYGNMRNAELVQILSAIGKASGAGYDANRTQRSKKRNLRLRNFFQRGNVIYERKGKAIKPVLVLTGAPNYTPRLDWQGKADAVVATNFMPNFIHRMEIAIATAKKV